MTKNKDATRYYSDRQEKSAAKVINGEQTSNSGAGRFRKGDVINQRASLLCECKCVMSEKSSISITLGLLICILYTSLQATSEHGENSL